MAAPEPPAIEDVYDEDILARIDGVLAPGGSLRSSAGEGVDERADAGVDDDGPAPAGRVGGVRRLGVGGAMLAGAMAGVGEMLEPERAREHIIEFAPDKLDEDEQLVTFHLLPGDPHASRIVVRPWLLEAFRRRRSGA